MGALGTVAVVVGAALAGSAGQVIEGGVGTGFAIIIGCYPKGVVGAVGRGN